MLYDLNGDDEERPGTKLTDHPMMPVGGRPLLLPAINKEIAENDDYDLDDFDPAELASLLDDVVQALHQAKAKGWGIIGTCG